MRLASHTMCVFSMCPAMIIPFAALDPKYSNALRNVPSESNFGTLMTTILNWFIGLSGLIAVLMLIIGGWYLLTAGGNDEGLKKGKESIRNAIIGIVVITLSYAVVYTLTSGLGAL